MSALTEFALFAGLSDIAKAELDACELRMYRKGEVVLRRGDVGLHFYVITKGSVFVHPGASEREISVVLGPGEVFGEMALLSNSPVSATVTAGRDSEIFTIPKRTFDKLFADESSFRQCIATLLAERLRQRTSGKERSPTCVLIAFPAPFAFLDRLFSILSRGVDYYAQVIDIRSGIGSGDKEVETVGKKIDLWRSSAHEGEVCIATVATSWLEALRPHVRPADAILLVEDEATPSDMANLIDWDFANIAVVRVGSNTRRKTRPDEMWAFRLDSAEIDSAALTSEWDRTKTPVLDSIVRWIARRGVGIALGAGAARGFAHIGVLKVLDSARVPIDCLTGSSIGGIIALVYAKTGSANGVFELSSTGMGSNQMIRDLCVLPRSSLFRGLKVRRNAERIGAGQHLADLTRPVIVVATDLLQGDRVVIDTGKFSTAVLATSAIPGVFPPIEIGSALAVDGAIVSRVPVDLLERRRCGLKIAVNVRSEPQVEKQRLPDLKRLMNAPFGLVRVIARSLDMVGSRHTATDLQGADIIITPHTHPLPGTDFGAMRAMVAAGEAEAERVLPDILKAVEEVLRPRR
jgi:NTE family protein